MRLVQVSFLLIPLLRLSLSTEEFSTRTTDDDAREIEEAHGQKEEYDARPPPTEELSETSRKSEEPLGASEPPPSDAKSAEMISGDEPQGGDMNGESQQSEDHEWWVSKVEADDNAAAWSDKGQVLAGVVNLNGFDFGIRINRMEFTKVKHDAKFSSVQFKQGVDSNKTDMEQLDPTQMQTQAQYWGEGTENLDQMVDTDKDPDAKPTGDEESSLLLLRESKAQPVQKGSKKLFLCEGTMHVKILGYNEELLAKGGKSGQLSEDDDSNDLGIDWNTLPKGSDLEGILASGFSGSVKLKGWWNNQNGHFRTESQKEEDVSDMNWMAYMNLPWQDLDCRFDNTGAVCRADFRKDSKWKESSARHYISFRLDAQEPTADPVKVYKGQGEIRGVDYALSIDMDDCKSGKKTSYGHPLHCNLNMRPLVVYTDNSPRTKMKPDEVDLDSDPEIRNKRLEERYASPAPSGGPWFSYMGMQGTLKLSLELNRGNKVTYNAKIQGSECWTEDPCPFLHFKDKVTFKVQRLSDQVLIEPIGQTEVNPKLLRLYLVYDRDTMEDQRENPQAIDPKIGRSMTMRPKSRAGDQGSPEEIYNQQLSNSQISKQIGRRQAAVDRCKEKQAAGIALREKKEEPAAAAPGFEDEEFDQATTPEKLSDDAELDQATTPAKVSKLQLNQKAEKLVDFDEMQEHLDALKQELEKLKAYHESKM